jgi:hypothetical protein
MQSRVTGSWAIEDVAQDGFPRAARCAWAAYGIERAVTAV